MSSSSEKELAEIAAAGSVDYQIRFVMSNLAHLRKVDRHKKLENAITNFARMNGRKESFSPSQMNFIMNIYEKTWEGANMPSIRMHIDRKRRGLRYGY